MHPYTQILNAAIEPKNHFNSAFKFYIIIRGLIRVHKGREQV